MAGNRQTHDADARPTDGRTKVAARCRNCGSVYSAWVFADDTVQPIGRKDGCQCGTAEFEALSN
ncbi:hypothetical protein J0X25_18855 [Haloterrigena alkaliphila]|nr:hypothetical protein [Haloterrigena alkaliphila]UHQ95012.1 hypothetical protein J0X25_18855 [Haloterrigena alkaliphila]